MIGVQWNWNVRYAIGRENSTRVQLNISESCRIAPAPDATVMRVQRWQWVGHTSLKTTSKYTHFPPEYRRKVVSELANCG